MNNGLRKQIMLHNIMLTNQNISKKGNSNKT